MEEQLKITLSQTIASFNNNRAAILRLALNNGGDEAIEKVENEYDTLRSAYFEILRNELDANHHLYEQLITATNSETERLKKSVLSLNNINEIIKLTTEVINLIGRILIVLAI
ncbi:hypothetical protein I6I98_13265 [Sphingobacterium multivorum]|uniref:Uncharacterized protein n=1 Tax=Sphingobacterium multivorum TaxID=28454 RepID=A0ABX7CXL6_SPHMU|nr:hypothetical protein [Sphingobacterium multivorum]QQT56170.1 hypothetical protein I6I98_13265 [Sphingobacterium multivorum]